ncbi:hypothetical protein HOD19_00560 [bacterium]|jgi:hypothetical protein|nr:hypothetical protein [bacterium]MBT4649458.1 hypothetical protein [bacterium]
MKTLKITLIGIIWIALCTALITPLFHDINYIAMSWEFSGVSLATEFQYFVKAIPAGIITAAIMAFICWYAIPKIVTSSRG